jgi:hypothetical protein
MFDLLSEDTIRLEEAAQIGRVHFSTAYRWAIRGVPSPGGGRVHLEVVRLGRAWLTSKQALARFSEKLTLIREGVPVPRTPSARQRASERAGKQLQEAGV